MSTIIKEVDIMIEYEKDYFETKLDNGNTLAIEDFLDGAIDIFEIPFE